MKNCIVNGSVNNFGLVECYKLSGSGCFPGSLTALTHLFVFTDESRNEMRGALLIFSTAFKQMDSFTLFSLSLRVFDREFGRCEIEPRCTSETSGAVRAPPVCRGPRCSPTSRRAGHGSVTPCVRHHVSGEHHLETAARLSSNIVSTWRIFIFLKKKG